MKKIYSRFIPIKNLKGLRKKGLTAFLLLAFSMNIMAQSAPKVSLNVKNAQVSTVFESLKKQTKIYFVYNHEEVNALPKVTLNLKDQPLETVLELLLTDSNLEYSIQQESIVIRLKKAKENKQSRKKILVSGVVTDDTNAPLPGASVVETGTNNGTMTNDKGQFQLNVEENGSITVSSLGMATQKIQVGGKTSFKISLNATSNGLKEVVVATGMFKKATQSYTGAATTITAKELETASNRNLIAAIRNIDPSFNVLVNNQAGSNPNAIPDVTIRGVSNLPNVNQVGYDDQVRALNAPYVILDGFPSTMQKLYDLNVDQVETITILKDASATAIYGSKAANGVIAITLKAPKAGKLEVSFRNNISVEAADLSAYNLLNARQKLDLEQIAGLYNDFRPENDLTRKSYYNFLLNEVNRGVNTYWLSQPIRNGVGQQHSLNLGGGDQSFRYSANVSLNDIQGAMKESGRKTYSASINLSYTFKKIKFSNNASYSQGYSQDSPYGNFSEYVRQNPYWRAFDENGKVLKYLGDPGDGSYTGRWNKLPVNPLYNATLNTFNKRENTGLTNNTSLEWQVLNELVMRGRLGISKGTNQSDIYRPADHTAFDDYGPENVFRKGDYQFGTGNNISYDASLNIAFTKTFVSKHTVFAGLDYSINSNTNSSYGFTAEGFSNPKFNFLSMALQYPANGKPSGSENTARTIGLVGNLNYIYDNRYMVEGSYRLDGSSQLGDQKKFAPFWSVGAGWNLDREAFFQNQSIVNRLKLRGSVGVTGAQFSAGNQAMTAYQYDMGDRYYNWTGANLLSLGNENLKWQSTLQSDIGIDAEFLNSRLKINADYYQKLTKDLISAVNLPASSGYASYAENMGNMQNKGYEVKVTGTMVRDTHRQLYWNLTVAAMHNSNKITKISEALKNAQKGMEAAKTATPNTLYREGQSISTIYVVPSLGIDPSTGKEMYRTADGNATFTWNGADMVAYGSTDPDILGNISSMVRYKKLTFNISFGYRTGGQLYNETLINKVENADFKYNVDARVYNDRWQNPGDIVEFKGLMVTTETGKTSRFVENETTINCQNINLAYDIRSDYIQKRFGVRRMSLSASWSDPFYVSTVKQERGTSYPFSRNFSFSLNTTF
ncbi:SusC/RagA family TonB-linked outer membrane protein [Solitalea sp. MAHUQ-68]|uniref:SusC/RagA family TonB-linked outer membrane protein n=1 Tax=Solitalea agri TaxID=2953739 RepID=A0A9X2F4B2_9SPHI|nr:SusC/RagA family TonB-linked outer membrane protein [Solitalea agri]MCO4294051.1 SusC/RagA family TonB-linked outer membrane protein [Solitalea agri]